MAGDEILITTTGKSAYEGEVRKINSVSGDGLTLTLNASLIYKHSGEFDMAKVMRKWYVIHRRTMQ